MKHVVCQRDYRNSSFSLQYYSFSVLCKEEGLHSSTDRVVGTIFKVSFELPTFTRHSSHYDHFPFSLSAHNQSSGLMALDSSSN